MSGVDMKTIQRNTIVTIINLLNRATVADVQFALARLSNEETEALHLHMLKVHHQLRLDYVKRGSRESRIADEFRKAEMAI